MQDGWVGALGAVVVSSLFIAEILVTEDVAVFLLFGLCLMLL